MPYVTITSDDKINWSSNTPIEKKINQINNIIRIKKGEVPFKRRLGISDTFVDNPITMIKPALINEVRNEISKNVEGVDIYTVDIVSGESSCDFKIKVVCEIE